MLSQEVISSIKFGFIFLAIFFALQVIITFIDEDYDSMTMRYIIATVGSMYFFNNVFVASLLWFKFVFIFITLGVLGHIFMNGFSSYFKN